MAAETKPKSGRITGAEERKRKRKVAKYLLQGDTKKDALLKAGYSEVTARKDKSRVINHPIVQSILTKAVGQVLKEKNKKFADIVRPFVDGLEAKLVVVDKGTAIETQLPDHQIRMQAANHLAKFHIAKEPDPEESKTGPSTQVNVHVNFIKTPHPRDPVIIPVDPTQSVALPPVAFRPSK